MPKEFEHRPHIPRNLDDFQPPTEIPDHTRPDVVDEICDLLVDGRNMKDICALLGLSYFAVMKYKERGVKDIEAGNISQPATWAKRILNAFTKGRLILEDETRYIEGKRSYLLEKKYPSLYGKDKEEEAHALKNMTTEELEAMLSMALANNPETVAKAIKADESGKLLRIVHRSVGHPGPNHGSEPEETPVENT